MKSPLVDQKSSSSKNLRKLVSFAVGNTMPAAVQRNNFVVNEVPREFQISADETLLATLLSSLLHMVVNISTHSCIRIEATEYDDIVFVSVRDRGNTGDYSVDGTLEKVQALAKKMNGNIRIGKRENNFTTILLSFPNFPIAA